MATKYIFVTGGVVSGLGKGITASSLGRLLKARGYQVTMQKFDPYINVDPGTMNPIQHGEVFVTDDGIETDLDLGHYERFIDESLTANSNFTTGKIYSSILNKERHGDYGGRTVQVVPHVTNEIKSCFYQGNGEDGIVIIEIGGTVGDIESEPYIEAMRQFQHEVGHENCMIILVTLIVYLKSSHELKTKPTQNSVKNLQSMGVQADILVCRSDQPLDDEIRDKLSLFCNVKKSRVIENLDCDIIYEIVMRMEKEHLAQEVCEILQLPCPVPDLKDWEEMLVAWKNPKHHVTVALVGKYVALHDAYLSVAEALRHGGVANYAEVEIRWIDSEKVDDSNAGRYYADVDAIIVPGGYGARGIEGMISTAKYAREHLIPYLGICFGMQMMVIEFARHVCKMPSANSLELDPGTPYPVIYIMPDQEGVVNLGNTQRLGKYECHLVEGTKAYEAYGTTPVWERHRHRYEVNNEYREALIKRGLVVSGTSPDGHIVEMAEISGHPWMVGTQAHPEFKSRPNKPHPLYRSFIEAAIKARSTKFSNFYHFDY
ncbi:MAG: CTP synthase [Erysipelotrichaceae bacterium]|jgi:CTP synthase|nr:CTP synthase [Erysipelotrichaceae bacterium]